MNVQRIYRKNPARLSPAEIAARRGSVLAAHHANRIQGVQVTAEEQAMLDRWTEGTVNAEDLLNDLRARYSENG
jgi:hypothetical protein